MEQGGASLPRAIDVQRFAGAREQEIRALCTTVKAGQLGAKFGVAALPRHLRRRAGSHKPYHNHRFRPNAKLESKRRKVDSDTAEGGNAAAAGDARPAAAEDASIKPRLTNRRMRRQPAALQDRFRQTAAWTEGSLAACAGAATNGSSSRDAAAGALEAAASSGSARRLETHVWHAKRLAMEQRYGWLLPAGAPGQGRNSRSFVHVTKASSLMHDASYLCPLLLRGAWQDVLGALAHLLDPALAASLADDWAAASSSGGGAGWEQVVLLHQPGCFPNQAICAAQLTVCPCSGGRTADSTASDTADGTATASPSTDAMDVDGSPAAAAAAAAAPAAAAETKQDGDGAGSSCAVDVVLWSHPGAAAEAAAALRACCSTRDPRASVLVTVLDLRRLEIRGGAADAALAAALAGATLPAAAKSTESEQRPLVAQTPGSQQGPLQQPASQQQQQRQSLPAFLAAMADTDVTQVLLPDPRLCKPVVVGSLSASLLPAGSEAAQPQALDVQSLQHVPPPAREAELSGRRQQLRRRLLQLEPADPGAAAGQLQRHASEQQAHCPAVIVRHRSSERGAVAGWSMVLPAGWVQPFWLAAAYAGCKPAGQREWRWLHRLQGRPFFPLDFPDTPAYSASMSQLQLEQLEVAGRRPPGKQQLAGPPCPPPWGQLVAGRCSNAKAGTDPPNQQRTPEPMAVDTAGQGGGASSDSIHHCSRLFVARSYATMAAALGSSSSSGGAAGLLSSSSSSPAISRGPRPVAAALRAGMLQWRPRQAQGAVPGAEAAAAAAAGAGAASEPAAAMTEADSSSCTAGAGPCCLLEAAVQLVKTGTVREGAALCFVAAREAQALHRPLTVLTVRQQRRRLREQEQAEVALLEAGGDPEAEAELAAGAVGLGEPSANRGGGDVSEELVRIFGHVLSEAPRGAPRRCGALAAVQAQAAWRLRSLQYWSPRLDSGAIAAFARNPGSAVLIPVHLWLLVEQHQR